ncbi:hypothetical protein [Kitasatospora sp. NPDC085879]|uniref:hypothetical protein n=1 Tax=Kitasatospora sp. NPDC085879 TaxID=3154769 RepID=UPI000BB0FB7A|nr:hypothetical protein [Streptomyces sp. TLI_235]PBC71640.1 hypothetical protein BX265_6252 [Streptomyces sp. TLI_235]
MPGPDRRTPDADAAMSPVALLCPRCGRPQRVVPGGPQRPVKVVHDDTGREDCERPDPAAGHPAPPAR